MIRANKYLRIANAKETLFGVVKTIAGKQSCKCQHSDTIRRGEQNERKKKTSSSGIFSRECKKLYSYPICCKIQRKPWVLGEKDDYKGWVVDYVAGDILSCLVFL